MRRVLQLLVAFAPIAVALDARLPHRVQKVSKSDVVNFRNTHKSRVEVALARGAHPYGDPKCPCVGFDNMQGEVTFQIDATTKALYPAETGGSCKAWDYEHYPRYCNTGNDDDLVRHSSEYPKWCLQQWCYVDPCNCKIEDNPKISKMMPQATFRGKTLYYSYATCGEKDIWTAQHHTGAHAFFEVKSGPCELTNFDTCVQSPNYPKGYGNNEYCEIQGSPGAAVQTTSFQTEHGFDFMKIDGASYHGGKGPDNVTLKSGLITWRSDGVVTNKGWQICTDTGSGACVNQFNEDSCKRLEKCAWNSEEKRCMGKETFGVCQTQDPMYGQHDPPCQCIGINGMYGATDVNVADAGEPEKLVKYPTSVGSACWAWDWGHHPDCKGDSPKSWCYKKWCYVSPCGCKIETPPKLSHYFPWVNYQGKPLYYSYATCGEADTYTEKENLKACVNQKTEGACAMLPKCAWTGKECLGKDLVEECIGLPEPKSSAWSSTPSVIFMVLLAFMA